VPCVCRCTAFFYSFDMEFAARYFEKYSNEHTQLAVTYHAMGMLVVIPCCNEAEIENTILSLYNCEPCNMWIGVVVVINSSESSPEEVFIQNEKTATRLAHLESKAPAWLSLHILRSEHLPRKWAGVGWARKIGMDWVVSHFQQTNNPDGIILSLDADTLVESNYLLSVVSYFQRHRQMVAATIPFEHPISNWETPSHADLGVIYYELYMRYYRNALKYHGFLHAMYTIGSCFAVRAKAYVAVGGMNRKQAGEDFYFLYKLVQNGEVGRIRGTTVYPSSRVSCRVPFGTGPMMKRWLDGDESILMTYPLEMFTELKKFFERIPEYYCQWEEIHSSVFHPLFTQYLQESGFHDECRMLRSNCSSLHAFETRFFHRFNAFWILKWLNFALLHGWPKELLNVECVKLFNRLGVSFNMENQDAKFLLRLFREMDRNES
jgi:hypothetical protein